MAVATDVASAAEVKTLVAGTEDAFGHIDLFCSNAGIIVGGGVGVPDKAWARSWAVKRRRLIHFRATGLAGGPVNERPGRDA
jgi:NAD(P)-dependent dehydrogenase (short-subunit alcohol dehydrogenase family)